MNKVQSAVDKLSGLEQEFIKDKLVKAFVSERVVTEVRIDWHGHLEIESLEWSDYWGELQFLPAELREALDLLKNARDKYFSKGFNSKHAAEYCFRYFSLLSQLLQKNSLMLGGELKGFLGRVLAFENFAIRWYGGRSGIAAGTASHRNPVYLLWCVFALFLADTYSQ